MFRCHKKKADWYLNRDLAEIVSQDPLTIKLKFNPNGLGNHEKDYGLDEMKNICVNCGKDKELTRHHIVPYCYRRYLPESIKSHNFHDVLPMCVECHNNYERKADILKERLSKDYDSPLAGEYIDNQFYKFTKMASTILQHENKMPTKISRRIKKQIKAKFYIKRLTKKKLIQISKMKSIVTKRTHGEIVMSKISDINGFIEMWREHFIQNNECKYLPDNWSIKNKT